MPKNIEGGFSRRRLPPHVLSQGLLSRSSLIKEVIQKQAQATRLTQKEVVYLGMLAIDALDKESRQELADKVHQMQVNGEI